MPAYFNLNSNKISKGHLANKFNMILDNQGRLMLNDQKIPLSNEPQSSLGFVQKHSPEVFCKKKLFLKSSEISQKTARVGVQHWCFPVKFAKFLRTSILKNICERLFLFVSPQNTIANNSVCTRRDLDKVQNKYFSFKHNNFIRSNIIYI